MVVHCGSQDLPSAARSIATAVRKAKDRVGSVAGGVGDAPDLKRYRLLLGSPRCAHRRVLGRGGHLWDAPRIQF